MNPWARWWLDYWRGLAEWRPRSPLLRLHVQTVRLNPDAATVTSLLRWRATHGQGQKTD